MCDKLMDAMTKIKIDGLTGVDGITWEKNGEPNKHLRVLRLKMVYMYPWTNSADKLK